MFGGALDRGEPPIGDREKAGDFTASFCRLRIFPYIRAARPQQRNQLCSVLQEFRTQLSRDHPRRRLDEQAGAVARD